MNFRILIISAVVAGAVVGGAPAGAAVPIPGGVRAASCAVAAPGQARCFARFRVGPRDGARATAAIPPKGGLGPAQIASAYRLSGTTAPGATVAVVDAYDDPHAEADLAVYRRHYGLPACTTATGCLRKVNQRGAARPLPPPDSGWAVEISLDLDAVSAACPSCKILLVEGDSPAFADLAAGVDAAARLHADVVSNSYGTDEFAGMRTYAAHYRHPGVTVVASSGDSGFGAASFPAVLVNVIAVGGTSLTRAAGTSRGWTEAAWSGAGSGCSAYVAKPSWQHDRHCPMRMVTDVSAVADPDSNFVIYDTYELGEDAGYLTTGGTSLSAPLVAAMIARAGRPLVDASPIYAHRDALYDARGGSTGFCGGDYLCTGRAHYDGPTGNGTPNGLTAL